MDTLLRRCLCCAQIGDSSACVRALEDGADVNARDKAHVTSSAATELTPTRLLQTRKTPLSWAAYHGDVEVSRLHSTPLDERH